MRYKPVVPALLPVLLLATLLMLLDVAMLSYRSAQGALLREANSLYSSSAVAVTGDVADALASAQRDGLDILLFLPIQNEDKTRAVVSARGTLDIHPMHEVQWKVSDARPGALAGANANPASGRINVLGTDYQIAGLLGAQDQSLIADDILIYDPAFFTEPTVQRFVIDGTDAAALATAFDDARPVAETISRRTNVDFVSPTMISLSIILLTLGAALLGYLANAWGAARDSIDRLWGRSRLMVFTRRAVIYTLAWIGAVGFAGVFLGGSSSTGNVFFEYALSSALLLGIFLLTFTVSFAAGNRGGK